MPSGNEGKEGTWQMIGGTVKGMAYASWSSKCGLRTPGVPGTLSEGSRGQNDFHNNTKMSLAFVTVTLMKVSGIIPRLHGV